MITTEQYNEIIGALVSLHKRIDELDRKVNNKGFRSTSATILLTEIKQEAAKTLLLLDRENNRD